MDDVIVLECLIILEKCSTEIHLLAGSRNVVGRLYDELDVEDGSLWHNLNGNVPESCKSHKQNVNCDVPNDLLIGLGWIG